MDTQNTFICSFESLEFPPNQFNHEAHVRLAWAYLQDCPLLEAAIRFRNALKRFARYLGKENKYHETITLMFMFLIHENFRSGEEWQEFKARNPELIQDGRAVLLDYYRPETLDSERARFRFVLPDRDHRRILAISPTDS